MKFYYSPFAVRKLFHEQPNGTDAAQITATLMAKSMSYMTRLPVVVAQKSNGQRAANGVEQKASHKPTTECEPYDSVRGLGGRVSPVVDIPYFRHDFAHGYSSRPKRSNAHFLCAGIPSHYRRFVK